MSKTIFIWGVILYGCVCFSQTSQASPLPWEVGHKQIQLELQARLVFASSQPPKMDDLSATRVPEVVLTGQWHKPVSALRIAEAQLPVLALPESRTLILLGIGLAGLASLMRKKKPSS